MKKTLLIAGIPLVMLLTISSISHSRNETSLDNESISCVIGEISYGEKEIFCNKISVSYLNSGDCSLEDPDGITELQDLPPDDAIFAVYCGNVLKGYVETSSAQKTHKYFARL
ncbi:MAG: hypothetical protein FWC26_01390 [Fibromonadales bacterium]|nr:hypothetical protein [Fibromonadales bacterium]